jgi:hypothetical protein
VQINDIFDDCRSITNFPDDDTNLSRITDAVEVLSNKGDFDALTGYVDLPIGPTGLIYLPRDVEVPIKVNLSDQPAFSRDKFYEFTMNAPGSNAPRLGWQWEDRLTSPIQTDLPNPANISFISGDSLDDGQTVTIQGRSNDTGEVVTETLILNFLTSPVSANVYSEIIEVHKDVTVANVLIETSPDGTILANYDKNDTRPEYRRIKVSVTSGVARILFRRSRFVARSVNDFIPIRSKIALILMLKALEAYRTERVDLAKSLEMEAVNKANEEQKTHSTFIDRSSQDEIATARNLNINNRDTIIVSDVYDDACSTFGPIGFSNIMDKITEAARILSNKAQWDAQRGYVDITTDQYHYVTLPRYVDYVIKLNMNKMKGKMQNKWFEFNAAGCSCLGSQDWIPCQTWIDIGSAVVLHDVLYTQALGARSDLDIDSDVEIRVFGFYKGKRIYSIDVNGNPVDGFLVPTSQDDAPTTSQLVDRIERITKSATSGYVSLFGYDTSGGTQVTLGYYWPDETEPNYRRIKIPQTCKTVRIMYRRKELKFSTFTDPIHLKSKSAIVMMMRAMKANENGKFQDAETLESKAVQYLSEEQAIMNQSEIPELEVDDSFILHYV